ncbi:AB hydrolase superfamily protein YvaM [Geobacillus sp. TFV-3]|nr:AB hydrolase superfamily protein YvaM [Geobacillus sp. TFV-3]
MPYVSINRRVRLYYEEKGEGTPLLFIHPPGMGHAVFCRQEPLARHFRLILYDMRGNGRSSSADAPITVAERRGSHVEQRETKQGEPRSGQPDRLKGGGGNGQRQRGYGETSETKSLVTTAKGCLMRQAPFLRSRIDLLLPAISLIEAIGLSD